MNLKNHITAPKLSALLTACALGLSSFAGVPAFAAEAQSEMPEAVAFSVDGSSELVQGTFVASDVACPAQDSYEYPFIGLNLTLPSDDRGTEYCRGRKGRHRIYGLGRQPCNDRHDRNV